MQALTSLVFSPIVNIRTSRIPLSRELMSHTKVDPSLPRNLYVRIAGCSLMAIDTMCGITSTCKWQSVS